MTDQRIARLDRTDGHPLHRVVYMSRATRALARPELTALCERAHDRNADCAVTGLLLHDGSRFIQALEGPEPAVHAIMRLIERDPRHHSISYMTDLPTARRQFGHWSMAVRHADDFDAAAAFLDEVKKDVAEVDDLRLSAAFIGFAAIGWRRRCPPYAG